MNQTFNQAIWPDEDLEKDLIHYFFFNKSKVKSFFGFF